MVAAWPSPDTNLRTAALDILYLLFLFVGVLESGPPLSLLPIDATVLFGGALGVGVTFVLVRTPVLKTSREGFVAQLLLAGLIGWLTLSLLWAPPSNYGLELVARLIIGITVAFAYPIWIVGSDESRIVRLLWFIVGFGLSLAVLYIIYGSIPQFVPNRISLSRPIGLASVILSARLATSSRQYVAVWIALLTVLFYVLFQSGARAPLGGALITSGALVLWLLRRRISSNDLFTPVRGAVAIGSMIVIGVVATQSGAPLPATLERFELLLQGGGASVSYRLQYWEWSINEWTTSISTMVIGSGVGSFSAEYAGVGSANYTHNIFIEVALAGGLVGLALFCSLLGLSFQGVANKTVVARPVHIAVVGTVAYMLINAQFSGNLYINKYLFLGLGLLICSRSISVVR